MDESKAEALVEVRLLGMPLRIRSQFLRHGEGLLRELSLIRIGAGQHRDAAPPARLLEVAAELENLYLPFKAAPAPAIEAALAAGADFCDVTYTVPVSTGASVQGLIDLLEEADGFCRREENLLTMPASPQVVAYRTWVFGEFLRQLAGQPPRPWAPPVVGPLGVPAPTHIGEPPVAVPAAGGAERSEGERSEGERSEGERSEGARSEGARSEGARSEVVGEDGELGWGEVVEQPLVVQPSAGSAALARRYVRRVLRAIRMQALEEPAELGVSELVTNAVLHARTDITLTVRAMPSGRVRIEVTDSSPLPVQSRPLGAGATTGRGLQLVTAGASAWGIDELPVGAGPGKTVWFELKEGAGEATAGEAGDETGSEFGEWDLVELL